MAKVKIPLNTNRYGGRIDHMYWSRLTDKEILGMYKLYDDASDHSPMIVDIFDPIQHRFNPDDIFNNYHTGTERNTDEFSINKIDESLDELQEYNEKMTRHLDPARC